MLSVLLLCSLLLGLASGQDGSQLSCSGLNVNRLAVPLSGAGLTLCQTEQDQCCTQEFLDDLRDRLSQDLLESLKREVTNRATVVNTIVDRFSSYFEGDFIDAIRDLVPAARLVSNLQDITSGLATFLSRANFNISATSPERNTTAIFVDLVSRIEAAVRSSGVVTDPVKQQCVINEINRHIRPQNLVTLGRTLEVVRRSFSGISRIVQFLTRFSQNLAGFTENNFPTECVNRLIDVSICGRCRRLIPPLCKNSCGAVVRGCFAAFHSGFFREFNNLWNVIGQLVETVEQAVRELFVAENDLLDIDIFQVARDCNLLDLLIGRRKRQAEGPMVPDSIRTTVDRLSGVFQYAPSGPGFCALTSAEERFCDAPTDGTDRSCAANAVCTSSCRCWDGAAMRASDIAQFLGVGIDEQGDNPVLQVPVEENVKIARSLSTAVNSFLISEDFSEVMPEGIEIPAPAPFQDPNGGSVPLVVSMVTLLGTVLFVLLVGGV